MSDYWAKEKWGDAQPYHAQETLDQKIHKKEQTRWRNLKTLFRMFFVTNIILGLDHGILPAATAELKEELLIGDVFLGFLGSLVFAGTMIGSIVAGLLLTTYPCKSVILISYGMCIVSYIVFPLAGQNKILLGGSRLVTGFFQVFMLVYFPVWVDFFGEKNKTRWVSYLQIGPPLGVFTGYALTAVFNEIGTYVSFVGWRWSFYIQILLLIPGGFILMRSPENLFATNLILSKRGKAEIDEDDKDKFPIVDRMRFTPRASLYIPNSKLDEDKLLELQQHSDISFDQDNDLANVRDYQKEIEEDDLFFELEEKNMFDQKMMAKEEEIFEEALNQNQNLMIPVPSG
jgi:hypothetical protein